MTFGLYLRMLINQPVKRNFNVTCFNQTLKNRPLGRFELAADQSSVTITINELHIVLAVAHCYS